MNRFRLLAGAADAIRRLNEAGYPVVVITNQSGVAKGYFPESLVRTVHELMLERLADSRARLDGIYYCPHASPVDCECRKPKIGMLVQAAGEHAIDLQRSFVVGDRYGDIELAHRAGASSVLVRTGYGEGDYLWNSPKWKCQPNFVAADLGDAVQWILRGK